MMEEQTQICETEFGFKIHQDPRVLKTTLLNAKEALQKKIFKKESQLKHLEKMNQNKELLKL